MKEVLNDMATLFQPGLNCWKVEQADRAAFLIDAENYFRAFYEAVSQARHCVFILGWDIDSRVDLLRQPTPRTHSASPPSILGDLFLNLVRQRQDLQIYVLAWDFAMVYAMEREWIPEFKIPWHSHARLHAYMDNCHPPGGCHHQKIVVIDDHLAFVGGLDLTHSRWDTSEHRINDSRRINPDGKAYPPFHDVQMMVEGQVAQAVGELARERWYRATGKSAEPPKPISPSPDLWPSWVTPDMQNVEVAISRTIPAYQDQEGVREIQQLYLDAIKAARRMIYVENQFLTSEIIGKALAERLQEPEGPEVLILLRRDGGDWLEKMTMDVLRTRLVRHLMHADRHGRLQIVYPDGPALQEHCLGLHSKVMIVDETFVRIGSANLTNRSMALDSECDLAVSANGREDLCKAILGFRHRLLAEHLGISQEVVETQLNSAGSLLQAIARIQGTERNLQPFAPDFSSPWDPWVPDSTLVDPEKPMEPERVVNHFIHPEDRPVARKQLMGFAVVLGILGLLAAAWRWTPLSEWVNVWVVADYLKALKDYPWMPMLILGGFLIGSVVMIPITGLIIISYLTFGPWMGFIYALIGSALGAGVTYGIGSWLGKEKLQRLAGSRINRLSQYFGERGLLSMVIAHMFPVGPFTIVNMLAGASHIGFRDFMIGTMIGMIPGLIALAILIDRVTATIQKPSMETIVLLVGVMGIMAAGAWLLARLLKKRAPHAVPSKP
jgi:phospholipase D1/2